MPAHPPRPIIAATDTLRTIASDWRCDAEAQPTGDPVHRCDRSGSRYRDGRWLCPRCFGLAGVRYVCGDRHEAARVPVEPRGAVPHIVDGPR
jgi:hypothetical protein